MEGPPDTLAVPHSFAPEQRALAECMSEMFMLALRVSWMEGLEKVLWDVAHEQHSWFGSVALTPAQCQRLRVLAAAAGGWVVSYSTSGLTWMPWDRWQAFARSWESATARRMARRTLHVEVFAAVARLGPVSSSLIHEWAWGQPPPADPPPPKD